MWLSAVLFVSYLVCGYSATTVPIMGIVLTRAVNVTEPVLRRAPAPNLQPWDSSPIFRDFPDDNTVNKVVRAFADMLLLATEALAALEEMSCGEDTAITTDMFRRYFRPEKLARVKTMYQNLLGLKESQFLGPVTRATFLEIFFNRQPPWGKADASDCAVENDIGAHLVQSHSLGRAAILMCPKLFEQPFPASLQYVLDDDCDDVGDYATYHMDAPGASMLHELLHWGVLTEATVTDYWDPNSNWIEDWNDPEEPGYDPNADPRDGYGPYHAMQVNKLHGRGHKNAENYQWFALEAFFSKHCDFEGEGRLAFDDSVAGTDTVYTGEPPDSVPP